MSLTYEQRSQLDDVNLTVNAIPYSDIPGPDEPPDWWTDQQMVGHSFVCRDYTQMKADRLRELGWPPSSLTVVLCYVETGQYHAILAVEPTAGETWFLDNRLNYIYANTLPLPLPYRGDRRQIPGSAEYEPFEFGQEA